MNDGSLSSHKNPHKSGVVGVCGWRNLQTSPKRIAFSCVRHFDKGNHFALG